MTVGLGVVIALALIFAFTNGFHDTAVSVATAVRTRALTPAAAVILAAGFNLLGALVGGQVAWQFSASLAPGLTSLTLVGLGLVSAIVWNLITWWQGLPTSSTTSLLGGLLGAGLAGGAPVHWWDALGVTLIGLVVFPVLAVLVSAVAMMVALHTVADASPAYANRRLRIGQSITTAAVSLGHGAQDVQKVVGVLLVAGALNGDPVWHWWMPVICGLALAAGTMAGGWRIIRTLARRITTVTPISGFVSSIVVAVVLLVTGFGGGTAVSTQYTVTGAVTGAGTVWPGVRAVRWDVLTRVVVSWLATIPATGALAAGLVFGFRLLPG